MADRLMETSPEITSQAKPRIVFICTGNVFRSLSAEFTARAGDTARAYEFSSAGTHTRVGRTLLEEVVAALNAHAIDPTPHVSRPLDQAIIDGADLLVAMDLNHQKFIRETFNRHAPLFLEVSRGLRAGIPDLPDVVPDWRNHRDEARACVTDTIDLIRAESHAFVKNLPYFLRKPPAPAAAP